MVNYQLGKIYKIVDNTNDNIYIGSTCEPTLARRLSGHVRKYKYYLKGLCNFITSFEIIKNNNYDIILIEEFPCENKMQLHQSERYYIENMKCINKIHPTRTHKEYRENNKDKLSEKNKLYRENNKDKISEKMKKYYKENKEQISEMNKIYYEENKNKIVQSVKEYNEKNKEKIQNKQNQKFICECGSNYTLSNKSHHLKTQKHQNYCQQINK